jgi:HEAT repeat protein
LNTLSARVSRFPYISELHFDGYSLESIRTVESIRTIPQITVNQRSKSLREEDRTKIVEAARRIFRKDKDEDVRAQAIFLIGQTATTNDDLRLVETAAQSAPSYTVRTRALMGLRAAPDDKGLPGIIAVAKSNAEVNTRKTAIRYLGQSKDPRAREALVEIASGLK